jgi:insulysin
VAPLLGEGSTEREMNAVDSEFNMGKSNDGRRLFVLSQRLSDPQGQYNRFNTGNLETLKKEGIRENLLNFHKTWYSANIMKLTVLGRHSLDKLQEWVTTMFTDVPNKNVVVPDLS